MQFGKYKGLVSFANHAIAEEWPEANLPRIMTRGSACADLAVLMDTTIKAGEHKMVRTGLMFIIEEGYHAKIYPRSSLLGKHGILIPTSIIDSDYRGEVFLSMLNLSTEDAELKSGERVAQMEVVKDGYALRGSEWLCNACRTGGIGSTDKQKSIEDAAFKRLTESIEKQDCRQSESTGCLKKKWLKLLKKALDSDDTFWRSIRAVAKQWLEDGCRNAKKAAEETKEAKEAKEAKKTAAETEEDYWDSCNGGCAAAPSDSCNDGCIGGCEEGGE